MTSGNGTTAMGDLNQSAAAEHVRYFRSLGRADMVSVLPISQAAGEGNELREGAVMELGKWKQQSK